MSPRGPELAHGEVLLRPLERRDGRAYREVRRHNRDWLRPWDATNPDAADVAPSFQELLRYYRRQERRGEALPMAVLVGGRFCGQVTAHGIQWGALRSAAIGYWIDRRMAGRGITPLAVALLTDHLLLDMGLHRVEINIRPENEASLRVVEKLGFRDEGLRERYMHIDGKWRDHRTFALVADDIPEGLTALWLHTLQAQQAHDDAAHSADDVD